LIEVDSDLLYYCMLFFTLCVMPISFYCFCLLSDWLAYKIQEATINHYVRVFNENKKTLGQVFRTIFGLVDRAENHCYKYFRNVALLYVFSQCFTSFVNCCRKCVTSFLSAPMNASYLDEKTQKNNFVSATTTSQDPCPCVPTGFPSNNSEIFKDVIFGTHNLGCPNYQPHCHGSFCNRNNTIANTGCHNSFYPSEYDNPNTDFRVDNSTEFENFCQNNDTPFNSPPLTPLSSNRNHNSYSSTNGPIRNRKGMLPLNNPICKPVYRGMTGNIAPVGIVNHFNRCGGNSFNTTFCRANNQKNVPSRGINNMMSPCGINNMMSFGCQTNERNCENVFPENVTPYESNYTNHTDETNTYEHNNTECVPDESKKFNEELFTILLNNLKEMNYSNPTEHGSQEPQNSNKMNRELLTFLLKYLKGTNYSNEIDQNVKDTLITFITEYLNNGLTTELYSQFVKLLIPYVSTFFHVDKDETMGQMFNLLIRCLNQSAMNGNGSCSSSLNGLNERGTTTSQSTNQTSGPNTNQTSGLNIGQTTNVPNASTRTTTTATDLKNKFEQILKSLGLDVSSMTKYVDGHSPESDGIRVYASMMQPKKTEEDGMMPVTNVPADSEEKNEMPGINVD